MKRVYFYIMVIALAVAIGFYAHEIWGFIVGIGLLLFAGSVRDRPNPDTDTHNEPPKIPAMDSIEKIDDETTVPDDYVPNPDSDPAIVSEISAWAGLDDM